MTQRIILFNGPPRCGKDTAVMACMQNYFGDYHKVFDRMSMPIKRAFAAMYGVPIDRWGNVEHWEHAKEDPVPPLGVSFRQWQIDFSEKFMKPLYGDRIFAELFLLRMKRQHPDAVAFVPDCGFDIEYSTLAGYYGTENVLVVKIYREGTTFAGDSRTYLRVGGDFPSGVLTHGKEQVKHLTNNSSQEDFELKVLRTVKEWLNAS